MSTHAFWGVEPCIYDKHGPKFNLDHLEKALVNEINHGSYFKERVKFMSTDTEKAIELVEDVNARFSKTISKFGNTMDNFVEHSKKASGNIRDAADKLSNGLLKIEKTANFDKLERYVELLERAASAMEILAALEKTGKLEKIAGALR